MVLAAIQKSPDAFRTISEVAAELGTPQHVLRFWESRFAQVKPLKRGGGRRYYRPDDVDLLRGIYSLLYRDGLTIKGVQKILREQGPRYVMELGRGSLSLLESRHAARPRLEEIAAWSIENGELEVPSDENEGHAADEHAGDEHAADGENKVREHASPLLPTEERAHFEAVLDDLLILKERLAASRSRASR